MPCLLIDPRIGGAGHRSLQPLAVRCVLVYSFCRPFGFDLGLRSWADSRWRPYREHFRFVGQYVVVVVVFCVLLVVPNPGQRTRKSFERIVDLYGIQYVTPLIHVFCCGILISPHERSCVHSSFHVLLACYWQTCNMLE